MINVKFKVKNNFDYKMRTSDGPYEIRGLSRPKTMQDLLDFISWGYDPQNNYYPTLFNTTFDLDINSNGKYSGNKDLSNYRFVQGKLKEYYKERSAGIEYVDQNDIKSNDVGLIAIDIDRPALKRNMAYDRHEVLSRMSKDFGSILWQPSGSVKKGDNRLKGRIFIYYAINPKTSIQFAIQEWFHKNYNVGYYVPGHVNNAPWFMGMTDAPSVILHEFIDVVSFRPSQKMNVYKEWFEVYADGEMFEGTFGDDFSWIPMREKRKIISHPFTIDKNIGPRAITGKYYVADKKDYGVVTNTTWPIRDLVPDGAGSDIVGLVMKYKESMRKRLKKAGITANISTDRKLVEAHREHFKTGVLYDIDELQMNGVVKTAKEWIDYFKTAGIKKANLTPYPNTHYAGKEKYIYWNGTYFINYHTGEHYHKLEQYTDIIYFNQYLPESFHKFSGHIAKQAPTGSGKTHNLRNRPDTILLVPTTALALDLHHKLIDTKSGFVYVASTDDKRHKLKRVEDIPPDRADCTIVMTFDKFGMNTEKFRNYRIVVDEANNLFKTTIDKYTKKRDEMIHNLFNYFEDVMFISADMGFADNIELVAEQHNVELQREVYRYNRTEEIYLINRTEAFMNDLKNKRFMMYCNSKVKAKQWADLTGAKIIMSGGDVSPLEVDKTKDSYIFTSAIREGYSFESDFDLIIADAISGSQEEAGHRTIIQSISRVRSNTKRVVLLSDSQPRKKIDISTYMYFVNDLLEESQYRELKQYLDGYFNIKNVIEGDHMYLSVLIGCYLAGSSSMDLDHDILIEHLQDAGYVVNYMYKPGENYPISKLLNTKRLKYTLAGKTEDQLIADISLAEETLGGAGMSLTLAKRYKSALKLLHKYRDIDDKDFFRDLSLEDSIKFVLDGPRTYAIDKYQKIYKAFRMMGYTMGDSIAVKELFKLLGVFLHTTMNVEKFLRFCKRAKIMPVATHLLVDHVPIRVDTFNDRNDKKILAYEDYHELNIHVTKIALVDPLEYYENFTTVTRYSGGVRLPDDQQLQEIFKSIGF